MKTIFDQNLSWLESWQEAQEKLIKQYMEWGKTIQDKSGNAEAVNPFIGEWINSQNDLTKQFIEAGKSIQQQFLKSPGDAHETVQQFMGLPVYEQLFKFWMDSLSKASGLGDMFGFQAGLGDQKKFLEDLFLKNNLFNWGGGNLAADFQKMFSAFPGLNQNLSGPLGGMIQQFTDSLNNLGPMSANWDTSNLKEMFGEYKEQFVKYLSAQKLGVDRERNEQIAQCIIAFMEYAELANEYMQKVGTISVQANLQLSKKLSELAAEGKSVTSFKELSNLWANEGDKYFAKEMGSPEFCKLQANYLDAQCKYNNFVNAMIEAELRDSPVATKGEVDLAYKKIYELSKEVRALKSKVQELTAAPASKSAPAASAKTSSSRTRKTSTRSTSKTQK